MNNKNNKPNLAICILLLIIVLLLISKVRSIIILLKDKYADYTYSIFVITKNYDNKLQYYEINKTFNRRKIAKFDAEDTQTYEVIDCIDFYIPEGTNRFKSRFNEDKCPVKNDSKLKEIAEKMAKLDNGALFDAKIMQTKNHYYVFNSYDARFDSINILYYYDDELKMIYREYGEEIIGIKENTFFNEGGTK